MQSNSDFEEILLAFNAASVKYLVVGAYALAAYARPRATGDIDLWVEASDENARRVYRALVTFGAFADAWPNRTPSIIGSVPVHVIGKSDLKRNKSATGRTQDLADLERLESDASD